MTDVPSPPSTTRIYFTDFFNVDPEVLESYGAFNVSLINDLPLFVDPFLLFDSKNPCYAALHEEIIRYVKFLRDRSLDTTTQGLLDHWFKFPEVKQNWLGFSRPLPYPAESRSTPVGAVSKARCSQHGQACQQRTR